MKRATKKVRLFDFSESVGRIAGDVWKNIDQLRAYLKRQGVGLIADGDSLLDGLIKSPNPNKVRNGAFTLRPNGPFIVLRKNATRREVMHELGHMLAWRDLGDAYWDLPSAQREHLASSFLRESSLWKKLSPEEQLQELMNIIPSGTIE